MPFFLSLPKWNVLTMLRGEGNFLFGANNQHHLAPFVPMLWEICGSVFLWT